jgi:hypothetical protein
MSEAGIWERNGPPALLVDQQSAVLIESDPQHCFPINENHSDMVKFSDDSREYRIVVERLHTLLHIAHIGSTTPPGSELFRPGHDENPLASTRPGSSKGLKPFNSGGRRATANSSRKYSTGSLVPLVSHNLEKPSSQSHTPVPKPIRNNDVEVAKAPRMLISHYGKQSERKLGQKRRSRSKRTSKVMGSLSRRLLKVSEWVHRTA